jgi:hypothetical protein
MHEHLDRKTPCPRNPVVIQTLPKHSDEEIFLNAMGCKAANVHLGTKNRTQNMLKDLKKRRDAGCGMRRGEWRRSWKETGSAIGTTEKEAGPFQPQVTIDAPDRSSQSSVPPYGGARHQQEQSIERIVGRNRKGSPCSPAAPRSKQMQEPQWWGGEEIPTVGGPKLRRIEFILRIPQERWLQHSSRLRMPNPGSSFLAN